MSKEYKAKGMDILATMAFLPRPSVVLQVADADAFRVRTRSLRWVVSWSTLADRNNRRSPQTELHSQSLSKIIMP
jgi:hypothetical protein